MKSEFQQPRSAHFPDAGQAVMAGGVAVAGAWPSFAAGGTPAACLVDASRYPDPCGDWTLDDMCARTGRRMPSTPARRRRTRRRSGAHAAGADWHWVELTVRTGSQGGIACSLCLVPGGHGIGAQAGRRPAPARRAAARGATAGRSDRRRGPGAHSSACSAPTATSSTRACGPIWPSIFTDDAVRELSGRRLHRQAQHPRAPVPQCRQRADGHGRAGRQPSLQPHEHPAGGAPRSGGHDGAVDAGGRWRCSAAWAAAPPGPKASTRCSTARKTASGRSRSSTTTPASARPMQRAGRRRRRHAAACRGGAPRRAAPAACASAGPGPATSDCEGFPAACIAPFHYANPGQPAAGAHAWTRGARRRSAVDRVDARSAWPNSRGARRASPTSSRSRTCSASTVTTTTARSGTRWRTCSPPTARIEFAQQGVFVGQRRVRQFLGTLGPHGLVSRAGSTTASSCRSIVTVAPDGQTARDRAAASCR